MKDSNLKTNKSSRRGHHEGNIRQRSDGRWEVRLSAGMDYKTGKAKRTSTCCNTRQEAICSILDQVSLWPFVVPCTESENLPYQIPSFFGVLQDKESLPSLEKKSLISSRGRHW